jgi:hypothetical protein
MFADRAHRRERYCASLLLRNLKEKQVWYTDSGCHSSSAGCSRSSAAKESSFTGANVSSGPVENEAMYLFSITESASQTAFGLVQFSDCLRDMARNAALAITEDP